MEKTKIVASDRLGKKYLSDLTVILVQQKKEDAPDITGLASINLKNACRHKDFKAGEKDVFIDYENNQNAKQFQGKRTAYIGLGILQKKTDPSELKEKFRAAGGAIAQLCKKIKARNVCIIQPDIHVLNDVAILCSIAEGVLLGDYSFDKYKTAETTKKDHYAGLLELRFKVKNSSLNPIRKALIDVKNIVDSVYHARNMANEPGSNWTAESFAAYAKALAVKKELNCRIFEKKELQKLGMGGILAVNRGSDKPPKMIVVEHFVSKKKKTLLLVGKGLTFDSGGISLKPAAGMEDMKYDMCGGAAVLAAMNWVGSYKPDCNVIAIVPSTDNMTGGAALKPGDIVVHYNKMSSEIINTDAEGRLILADALAYGIERYTPDYVIDLATLTGAVIIGLGHHFTGLLSNNDELAEKLIQAGKHCGEPTWRLPLGPQYKKQIESKIADMKNTGGRPAGAITAAEYLHNFVGKTPWAHLDIAGTAWGFTEKTYIPEAGPTGICVRTIVQFLKDFK